MAHLIIRSYQKQDEAAIEEIIYRTGYNGEDLTGLHYIDDKRLFFIIFGAYYVWYEPEHCFVAVDADTNQVVGYIFGTADTIAQEARSKKMLWFIYLRMFLFTSWRHPQTFRTLRQMDQMRPNPPHTGPAPVYDYPAHLHINVLPEYQGRGAGSELIQRFEAHIKALGISGLHLGTSNYNVKAIPFYKKLGFTIIKEFQFGPHPRLADYGIIFFAKKLL